MGLRSIFGNGTLSILMSLIFPGGGGSALTPSLDPGMQSVISFDQ